MTTATATNNTTVENTIVENTGAELITAPRAKVTTDSITAGVDPKNRISLIEPNEVLSWMPKLRILENCTVRGQEIMPDGQIFEHEHAVDNGYKIAGHIDRDGVFRTCPWMKSDSYSETSHDFVLGSIIDNLNGRGLKNGIWRTNLTRNLGCMRTDILLKEYYKVNEDAFEDDLGVRYNNKELKTAPSCHIPGDTGLYQPCVSVINSFFGSSKVLFSILRLYCLNGMFHIADSFTISFGHMQKNIIDSFEKKSNTFLDKIFAGKELENMIMNMQNDHLTISTFLEWMMQVAGPKATDSVFEQFNIPENFGVEYDDKGQMVKGMDSQVNRWVAYNMMTWAASHMITSQLRQNRMFAQFNKLPSVVA